MADIKIYGTLVRDVNYNTPEKIVRGYQVEGGYFVCEELPSWGDVGQLCYCSTDKKFYQFDGTNWVNKRWDELVPALDTLISTDSGKSVRTIANEELAEQLLSDKADASFKTLQELAAWIEDHPENVAAINASIQQLREDLASEAQTRYDEDLKLTNDLHNLETSMKEYIEQILFETEYVIDANLIEE